MGRRVGVGGGDLEGRAGGRRSKSREHAEEFSTESNEKNEERRGRENEMRIIRAVRIKRNADADAAAAAAAAAVNGQTRRCVSRPKSGLICACSLSL